MSSLPRPCPMHVSEDIFGTMDADGAYAFTCTLSDHPGGGPFSWIEDPIAEDDLGLGGLADELGLDVELPAALASLGSGWVEYGLVERAYAVAKPDDFCQMVRRWGHSSLPGGNRHSSSAYVAGVLGRLAKAGAVSLRFGPGTGRWDYNTQISYWSLDPTADWEQRTTWISEVGEGEPDPCLEYTERC